MISRFLEGRLKYLFLVILIVVFYLIWGVSSARNISIKADKTISTIEQIAIVKTIQQLPQSDAGFVNGYTVTKHDTQQISNLQSVIASQLKSVSKFPITGFTYSVNAQFVGPSVMKIDLSWSYTVPRLGWPLVEYSREYPLVLEHASDGSVKSLDQSGNVLSPSQEVHLPS